MALNREVSGRCTANHFNTSIYPAHGNTGDGGTEFKCPCLWEKDGEVNYLVLFGEVGLFLSRCFNRRILLDIHDIPPHCAAGKGFPQEGGLATFAFPFG